MLYGLQLEYAKIPACYISAKVFEMSYRVQTVDDEFVSNKNKKDKAGVKYPKSFSKKLSMSKVNLSVVEKWIGDTLNEQLLDDDVVIDYVCELLQAEDQPDIKMIHLQMQDFLGKDQSMKFCEVLWNMLLSAQDDPDGIPLALLEQRRKEYETREKPVNETKGRTNYNRGGTSSTETPRNARSNGDNDRKVRREGSHGPGYDKRDKHRDNQSYNRDRDPQDTRSRDYRRIRPQYSSESGPRGL